MKLTSKNLYAYCDNNPISKKDLNGEFAVPAILDAKARERAIGAIIGVASY